MIIIGKIIDLTGQRFGKLTVIERADDYVTPSGYKKIMWKCVCDCGNTVITSRGNLRSGHTRSCGCLWEETVVTHGKRNSRLYYIWAGIKQRCYNKNCDRYKWYGALGVNMCSEWKDNFYAFYEWSIKSGYDENAEYGECTLDRIDPTGDYSPENCRWASLFEQSINKRIKTKQAVYKGVEKPLSMWCKELGLDSHLVANRLSLGWSVEDAFETQQKHHKTRQSARKLKFNNEYKTVREWSEDLGIPKWKINWRLRNGWTEEEALTGKK